MKLTTAEMRKLRRYKLSKLDSPRMTPKHKTKKAVVAIRNPKTKKIRVIRFGAQGYGHNYALAARKSFKARHAKNIKKGKTSAAYWADKFLWAGPNKRTKNPPKRRS